MVQCLVTSPNVHRMTRVAAGSVPRARHLPVQRVRSNQVRASAAPPSASTSTLYENLEINLDNYRRAPISLVRQA
jgi:hypothetical protein